MYGACISQQKAGKYSESQMETAIGFFEMENLLGSLKIFIAEWTARPGHTVIVDSSRKGNNMTSDKGIMPSLLAKSFPSSRKSRKVRVAPSRLLPSNPWHAERYAFYFIDCHRQLDQKYLAMLC
jgi:hypothetical protein